MGALGDDVLEVGPGPGLTTDLLRERVQSLTALESDPQLAQALQARLTGTNVIVIHGDASSPGLPSGRFSSVCCFSMFHHVPSAERQDRVFDEMVRVLRPGGILVGEDPVDTPLARLGHTGDTFTPLAPATLGHRMSAAGRDRAQVEVANNRIKFSAVKP